MRRGGGVGGERRNYCESKKVLPSCLRSLRFPVSPAAPKFAVSHPQSRAAKRAARSPTALPAAASLPPSLPPSFPPGLPPSLRPLLSVPPGRAEPCRAVPR